MLLLFVGNLRAALIAAAFILFSMLISFLGMRLFGICANVMSLCAFDFNMILDGAVVMMKNSVHRFAKNDTARRFHWNRSAVRHEVAPPMTYSVAVIVAGYLPILFLQGLGGACFGPSQSRYALLWFDLFC